MKKLTSAGLERRPDSDFDIATARPLAPQSRDDSGEYVPTTEELVKAWVSYRIDYDRFGNEHVGRGDAIAAEARRSLATDRAAAQREVIEWYERNTTVPARTNLEARTHFALTQTGATDK